MPSEMIKSYGIYPQDRFHEKTAVRVFQNTHSFHYYAKEAEESLDLYLDAINRI
jgi:hypothetical protein